MTFIDIIEAFGVKVDAGTMARDDAIAQLIELSPGGLLVEAHAAAFIDRWQFVRVEAEQANSRYEEILNASRR